MASSFYPDSLTRFFSSMASSFHPVQRLIPTSLFYPQSFLIQEVLQRVPLRFEYLSSRFRSAVHFPSVLQICSISHPLPFLFKMLPRQLIQKSATLWKSSRRRSFICLHRLIASTGFQRFLNYVIILFSYQISPSRLLSFFLSRDQYQGRILRAGIWTCATLVLWLFPEWSVLLSPTQELFVLWSMWSVSNLKDRGRLVLYIRLLILELVLCSTSPLWSPTGSCEAYSLCSQEFRPEPLIGIASPSSDPVGRLEENDQEDHEDLPITTTIVAVNNHLSIYTLPCCTTVFSVFTWLWESLFYFFM